MNYKDIIIEYHQGLLNAEKTVDLIQFLLDTDLIYDYPELMDVADYYIMEGMCYHVHSWLSSCTQKTPKTVTQRRLLGVFLYGLHLSLKYIMQRDGT